MSDFALDRCPVCGVANHVCPADPGASVPDVVIDSVIFKNEVPMSSYVALEHVYKVDANGEPFELWYAPGDPIAMPDLDTVMDRGCAVSDKVALDDPRGLELAIAKVAKAKVRAGEHVPIEKPDTLQVKVQEQREAFAAAEAETSAQPYPEVGDARPPAEGGSMILYNEEGVEPDVAANAPQEPADAPDGAEFEAKSAEGEQEGAQEPQEGTEPAAEDSGAEVEDKAVRGPQDEPKKRVRRKPNEE